jgi:leukotriene-A4 hydrolase
MHPRHEAYGSALEIALSNPLKKDEAAKIKIFYATTDKCSAVQWLTPR